MLPCNSLDLHRPSGIPQPPIPFIGHLLLKATIICGGLQGTQGCSGVGHCLPKGMHGTGWGEMIGIQHPPHGLLGDATWGTGIVGSKGVVGTGPPRGIAGFGNGSYISITGPMPFTIPFSCWRRHCLRTESGAIQFRKGHNNLVMIEMKKLKLWCAHEFRTFIVKLLH